jgi:hypothetical protein
MSGSLVKGLIMYRESLLMSALADLLITRGLRNELRGQTQ